MGDYVSIFICSWGLYCNAMAKLSCTVCTIFPVWAIICRATWVCLLDQCACAAAQHSVIQALTKCWTDWLGLAVSPSRVTDFLHCLLKSVPYSPAEQQMSVNHRRERKKRNQILSLTLSSLSHISLCLQPCRTSNSILACHPHPSCLYQWLIYYFASFTKKITLCLMSFAVTLTWQARSTHKRSSIAPVVQFKDMYVNCLHSTRPCSF